MHKKTLKRWSSLHVLNPCLD